MIWPLIPGPIKRALAWLAVGLVALAGTWGLAKRDARRGAALEAARGAIKSHEVRNDVEASIDHGGDPKRGLRSGWRR